MLIIVKICRLLMKMIQVKVSNGEVIIAAGIALVILVAIFIVENGD